MELFDWCRIDAPSAPTATVNVILSLTQNLSMLIKWYFLVPTRKYRKEALDLLLRSLIKVTVSLEQVNSLTLKQHLLCYCETEHCLLTSQRSIIKEYLSRLNKIIDSGSEAGVMWNDCSVILINLARLVKAGFWLCIISLKSFFYVFRNY